MTRLLAPLVLLTGAAVALVPSPAGGCAVAPMPGQSVSVSDESALIVWDAATKTEHFTRRARFAVTSADFGFLVPTPTKPTLSAVKDGAFDQFGIMTAARHEYVTKYVTEFGFGCMPASKMASDDTRSGAVTTTAAMPAPREAVQVLGKQRVGQLDATILKADDAQALRDWLDKNGYPARPELVEWLKRYTDDKWVITAFKIAAGPAPAGQPTSADATAVRLSFAADKPFYPYREPADARTGTTAARSLRVFLLADRKMAGTLGADGVWPGRTVWANALPAGSPLPDDIGLTADTAYHLTEFRDDSSPRPGTDEVFFAPAADQAKVERPPIIHETVETRLVPGPVVGFALALLLPLAGIVAGAFVVRTMRKKA